MNDNLLRHLPESFGEENLRAHMALEKKLGRPLHISFGELLSPEDTNAIMEAYNYLQSQGEGMPSDPGPLPEIQTRGTWGSTKHTLPRKTGPAGATTKQQLLHRLESLRNRPQEEQQPQAQRPTERAFTDAQAFITALPDHLAKMPHLSLADDGEINLLWSWESLHIDPDPVDIQALRGRAN